MSVTIFAFEPADQSAWRVVNDGVMGGHSAGYVTVQEGILLFTGTLVTQDGGFTSVRGQRAMDLTDQVGLELRVRGSAREFQVELDDGLQDGGRRVSRRAPFLPANDWTVIRVPFSALGTTVHGRLVNAPQIDLEDIRGVGLYIADGQDGPFRLEVNYIRAYAAGEA